MRREAFMFVLSTIATTYLVGIVGTTGLFVFGLLWLWIGED